MKEKVKDILNSSIMKYNSDEVCVISNIYDKIILNCKI